jgi:UDP-galactopyranose mutase
MTTGVRSMQSGGDDAGMGSRPDVICLSHLRWGFVFQRPQHLLSRFAARQRVLFYEEPVADEGPSRLESHVSREGVLVATPHLPHDIMADPRERTAVQRELLDELLDRRGVREFLLWYYTPMALAFSEHLQPLATVYDCMDELSHFAGAPPELRQRERDLLARADLVFTGGQSLYEAKRHSHPHVHCFPSSVDAGHFRRARETIAAPADQANVPRPRIGYAGVIDERMDYDLLDRVAELRPDWQLVMLGPVAKVDPATLPKRPNIHWLGMKRYDELPTYLAGWDVAMLPFAHNDATRYISPTKTPEYLAAGLPVVSTAIRDVVRPYGTKGLALIADGADPFVAAIDQALALDREAHRTRADAVLALGSWDRTATQMMEAIDRALVGRAGSLLATGMGARL